MKIGYVRVSKHEQNEALQIDALKAAGCEKWFVDKITGSKAERKGLNEALAYARPGDTFIVWKLDRAGRSLKHLIELLTHLDQHQIGFRSLTEQIDTTTPGGKLIFHLMGALAEFEEHTSELQSPCNLVCRLLLEKKKNKHIDISDTRT